MNIKDLLPGGPQIKKIKEFLVGRIEEYEPAGPAHYGPGSRDPGFLQIATAGLLICLLPYMIDVFNEDMARGYCVVENSPKQVAVQFYSDPLIKGYDHKKTGRLDSLVSISFSYRIPMYHEFDIPRYSDEFKRFDSIYHNGFVNDTSLKNK